MLSINSTRSETFIKQDNHQKVEAKPAQDTSAKSPETSAAAISSTNQGVTLSDRALRIQKLNEEFFADGPGSLRITPTFISRLEEYGLINNAEARRLAPLATETSTSDSGREDKGTLKELMEFADRFSKELKEQDEEHALLDTLDKAKSVLSNFNGAQPSSSNVNIRLVAEELSRYSRSEEGEGLSDDNRDSLQKLELSMRIADRLNPTAMSNSKVNGYLSVLNRLY